MVTEPPLIVVSSLYFVARLTLTLSFPILFSTLPKLKSASKPSEKPFKILIPKLPYNLFTPPSQQKL